MSGDQRILSNRGGSLPVQLVGCADPGIQPAHAGHVLIEDCLLNHFDI
jgi:hypothetical protein